MTKIKTILVDDEVNSRELLTYMLRRFPQIDIVGEAAGVEQALEVIPQTAPQLVFLDIQMPVASGFDLLKRFNPLPFEVVFVTSYDQYAINAIKFNALDYLLKPVDYESLEHAVKKVEYNIGQKIGNEVKIVNLLHNLNSATADLRLAVHVGDKVRILNTSDIVYIEGEGRYSHMHTPGSERYTTARNIKEFEEFLGEDSSFIRISRSVLLNTAFIASYTKGEQLSIETRNGLTFNVPRRKRTEMLDKLLRKNT